MDYTLALRNFHARGAGHDVLLLVYVPGRPSGALYIYIYILMASDACAERVGGTEIVMAELSWIGNSRVGYIPKGINYNSA